MRQLLFKSAFLCRACLCCRAGQGWAVPSALAFSCVCPAHAQEWVSVLVQICSNFYCCHWHFLPNPELSERNIYCPWRASKCCGGKQQWCGIQEAGRHMQLLVQEKKEAKDQKILFSTVGKRVPSRDKALKQWGMTSLVVLNLGCRGCVFPERLSSARDTNSTPRINLRLDFQQQELRVKGPLSE